MRIDYIRDGLIEEFHEGKLLRYPDRNIYPEPYYLRSCAKPLQAALLVDYDADLTDKELALCCGSHAGEECHLEVARGIMKKYGITEDMLKCGVHAPLSRTMQDKMLLRGEKPSQIHNNCSGKHLGFLVLCKINGWDTENYYELEHPLHQAVIKKIYEMCRIEGEKKVCENTPHSLRDFPRKGGRKRANLAQETLPPLRGKWSETEGGCQKNFNSSHYPITNDGCGVPIVSMPLYNLLCGYINLLKYDKIINAIINNPYIFGGENRLDTEIIKKTDGLVAKVGAGGLCVVLNTKKQDAFVVKINDCSMEARRFAVLETINRLGWGKIDFDNKIRTISGKVVGEVVVNL